jgi:hypothetical protein
MLIAYIVLLLQCVIITACLGRNVQRIYRGWTVTELTADVTAVCTATAIARSVND